MDADQLASLSPISERRVPFSLVTRLVALIVATSCLCVTYGQTPDGEPSSQTQSITVLTSPTATASTSDAGNKPPQQSIVTRAISKSRNWLVSEKISQTTTNLLRILNILAAVFIGSLGALAFYAGVRFGFISPESRRVVLLYLPELRHARPSRAYFYFLGGIVAGIFQWAQPDVLAPIQAFVLGATWPSVVTRIMSGSSSLPPAPSVDDILNKPPSSAARQSAQDAVVVITPPVATPTDTTGKTGKSGVQDNPTNS
jgi:hypothetical protein